MVGKYLEPKSKFKNEVMEDEVLMLNGVLLVIDEKGKAVKIEKLYQEL